MAEKTIPKLNLKALKLEVPKPAETRKGEETTTENKISTQVDAPTLAPEAIKPDTNKAPAAPKMSFASIRKETDADEDATPPETKDAALSETIPATEVETAVEKISAEDPEISSTKIQEEKTEKETTEEEKKSDEPIKFNNYESHFKKESTNFLKKFQKFRYTPKTRVGLIFGLISVTAMIIGGLMFTMPDKHSPEIYRASIMQLLGKTPEVAPDLPVEEAAKNVSTQAEIISPPIEEEIELVPEMTKSEKSKAKLKQHLLEKYSH